MLSMTNTKSTSDFLVTFKFGAYATEPPKIVPMDISSNSLVTFLAILIRLDVSFSDSIRNSKKIELYIYCCIKKDHIYIVAVSQKYTKNFLGMYHANATATEKIKEVSLEDREINTEQWGAWAKKYGDSLVAMEPIVIEKTLNSSETSPGNKEHTADSIFASR